MYRTIDAAFWTDPRVRQIEFKAKALLLYFITNPHTHVSGIYYLPRAIVSHETSLSSPVVDTLCHTLSSVGFCGFDALRELIWVKNMMKYQGRGEKNMKSAAHHVTEDLHNSPLIVEFLAAYPDVKALISDRVYHRISEFGTPDPESPFPIPESPFLNTDINPATKFGPFKNVKLSEVELEKLAAKFGNAEAEKRIEALSEYIASKGKKYASHYATILTWDRKNGPANGNSSRPKYPDIQQHDPESAPLVTDDDPELQALRASRHAKT